MTVIKSKKISKEKVIAFFGGVILLAMFFWLLVLHNQIVDFYHEIETLKKAKEKEEVRNAELKNEIYQLTNFENIEQFIKERGLVKEKNPIYLSFKTKVKETSLVELNQ